MKLELRQLPRHLQGDLAPLYLVYGDEPLQVGEACDAIRARARAEGFEERLVFHAESGFDWNQLLEAAAGMSLFGSRRLLELRLGGKPGETGARVLEAYAERPPPDTVFLASAGRLESAQLRSRWYRALERAGVVVPVWPLAPRELPSWIRRRMQDAGMRPSAAAVTLLAERVEGNLLAAAQEIEKLALLHGPGALGEEEVLAAVADSARFDLFTLVDSALAGDVRRSVRILAGLRREGVEPVLVLWALARELRSLAAMAGARENGLPVEQVLARHRVWERRKPLLRRALQRLDRGTCLALLRRLAWIDRLIKGQAPEARSGNVWDELIQLTLRMGLPAGELPGSGRVRQPQRLRVRDDRQIHASDE